MHVNQHKWHQWAQYLQRTHLIGFFSFLLDAAGPVRIIAAQSLLLAQPFFHYSNLDDLATLLEDQEQSQAFLEYINQKEFNE